MREGQSFAVNAYVVSMEYTIAKNARTKAIIEAYIILNPILPKNSPHLLNMHYGFFNHVCNIYFFYYLKLIFIRFKDNTCK